MSHHVLAPYVATPMNVVEAMLRLAEVGTRDTLLDLGCGDGRVAIAAARLCGATSVGVDCEPYWVEQATVAARQAGVSEQVRFVHADALSFVPAGADVVFLYLVEWSTRRVLDHVLPHLAPGARVVSHSFWPLDMEPVMTRTVEGDDGEPRRLHLFCVPDV